MRTLIRFFGLPRSGNHPIINWIVGQYQDAGYQTKFDNNKRIDFLNGVKPYLPSNPSSDYLADKNLYLVSHEYMTLFDIPAIDPEIAKCYGKVMNILVLRDPFNWVASRIQSQLVKRPQFKDKSLSTAMSFFKMYAYEFIGQTNYLDNRVVINYDRWNVDRDYRQDWTDDNLGVPFTDKNFDVMSKEGGGSSFDPKNIDPAELHEHVMHRWQQMADNADFRAVFAGQQEVFDLSAKIFGPIEGTDILL